MAKHAYISRITSLHKGKVKSLGLFETLKMKLLGWLDGRRGLPREDDEHGWRSPHLDREVRAYEEFCGRMWGGLQIESETAYARMGDMLDKIAQTERLLGEAMEKLKASIQLENATGIERKNGEERLTDAQVKSRREKEKAARLSPAKNHVASLENTLSTSLQELFAARNDVREKENSTRMVCARVMEHTAQRLDVYWHSALKKHPEHDSMPVIPCVELKNDAERIYMEAHRSLLQKTEALLNSSSEQKAQEVA